MHAKYMHKCITITLKTPCTQIECRHDNCLTESVIGIHTEKKKRMLCVEMNEEYPLKSVDFDSAIARTRVV